ncbi:MAG: ABC transporter permease [Acidimicrobiales bacterium]
MTPIWAWARREVMRRRRATLALVLLVGLSGAVALTAAAGAQRTGTAYERFLDAARTADARLQYSSTGPALDARVLEALRSDPGVEAATPVWITLASAVETDVPYDLSVYNGSEPALFDTVDGVRIVEGSAPDPHEPNQVTINRFLQRVTGLGVGDTIALGTFVPEQIGPEGEPQSDPAGPVVDVEVVGIRESPYDLADPETAAFFGTMAFRQAYGDDAFAYGPTVEVVTRPGADVTAVVERVVEDLDLEDVGVEAISDQTDRVSDSTNVLAVGLAAFAVAAALAATVAAAQALHRRMGECAPDLPALRSLGLTRAQCGVALMSVVAPIVACGVVLAVLLAIAASPLMPIGIARRAEPDAGIHVDPGVLAGGALIMFGVLAVTTAVSGSRLARRATDPLVAVSASSTRGRWLRSPLRPPAQLGVAMALDPGQGPRAVPVRSALIAAAFGAAGVIAALTFGAGLDRLVEEPAASGWNWTFAPEVSEDDAQAVLDARDVTDAGRLQFSQIVAGGDRMTAVSVGAIKGTPSLTVVRGRMPVASREAALGPKTSERLGADIGDQLIVEGPDGDEHELVVVGEVLLPTFDENPFNEGIALAPDFHQTVIPEDEGFDRGIVTFESGITQDEAASRMEQLVPGSMSVYAHPSPPPDVANLEAVRFLPRLLGLFLGVLALAAVGHALATSTRRRRHDLGIVRSFGFVGRDLRRALGAQSMTLIGGGLLLGIPIGIAIGRTAWKVVADGIGVRPEATAALGMLLAVIACGLVASLLLAVVPGRAAARRSTVAALRVE